MVKSLILSVLLLYSVGTSVAQVLQIPLNRSKSKQSVVHKSNSGTRYFFSHDFIYSKSNLSKDGSVYSSIWLNKSYPSGSVGEPNIPAYKKLIIIPKGAKPIVSIISNTEQVINLKENRIDKPIYPNQPSVSKNQDSSKVEFVINKSSYSKRTYKNNPIATIEVLGNLRSATIARLVVNPIDYNPGDGIIKVYNDIEVAVDFGNTTISIDEQIADPKTFSPYFESIYNRLGYENSSVYNENPDLTKYPVKMLIVSNRMFESSLQPFIQWKTSKGFNVKTVYTDIIGTTPSAIKTFIQQEYNSATPESPAPTFLLLVGDAEQTAASDFGTETGRKTDLYYASVDGDMFPEMYYGRLSAIDKNQLDNIISKILYYEKYQFADPSYLNKVTLIAGVDGSGWTSKVGIPTIKYGTANYFKASNGFTTVNEFGISSDPNNPSSIAGYDNCYSPERIATGFINYTAHGGETGWVEPALGNGTISTFSNTNKYPLVIGNCCLTGDFGYSECFGESWIRAKDKGAVAYIGSSPNSFWYEDFYWSVGAFPIVGSNNGYVPTFQETTTGAYDAPFVSSYTSLGGMVFAGNLAVTEVNLKGFTKTQTSSDQYYWEAYNILGDPSLIPFFTEAEQNQVTIPSTIVVGQTSIKINALENSYVAVSKNGQLLGTKIFTSTGEQDVTISNLIELGDVTVTVTRPQTVPVIQTIQAVSPNGPYLLLDSFTIDDSDANNNGKADYNETFGVTLKIKNIGISNATNVSVKISGVDPYLSIIGNDSISAIDVPITPGANYIDLPNAFSLVVAENVPDRNVSELTLKFFSDQGQWDSKLRVPINSPALSLGAIQIDDNFSGCDNDGKLNPGETCRILVPLKNTGHSLANDVSLSINIPDSIKNYISVSDIQTAPFSIDEGSTVIVPFNISVNSTLRAELIIPIKIQANVVNPSGLSQLFEKSIEVSHKGVNITNGSLTTCFTYFFDSGGKDNSYSSNQNLTFTFNSASTNSWLKASVLEFSTEVGFDFLYIYDGASINSPQIAGSPFSGTEIPKNILSTNGSLTFKFTSDDNKIDNGWKIMIECIEPQIPECATNPKPTIAEQLVKSTKLSWSAQPLASFYDVYIGTAPQDLTFVGRVTTSEILFVPIKNTTYYWNVKPGNSIGINSNNCNLWSFTTDTISTIEMSTNIFAVDTVLFYDSGGPNSNYKNSEDYSLTFKPRITGHKISVSFLEFSIEANATCKYDKLSIFDGLTTSSPLLGTYCGNNSPENVKATNSDGALTFQFQSDGYDTFIGWKAIVRSEKTTSTPIPTIKKARVYPNPTNDKITIESDYPIKRIALSNTLGSILVNKTASNSKLLTLSLEDRTPGVYILIIYSENSIPEKTLIIKK